MIRRQPIELEIEAQTRDRARAFLNNPLGLPIAANNDGKYYIGKTNMLDYDYKITVLESFLVRAGNHNKVVGAGTMEGVFVFLGNIRSDTSEAGKERIVEELSNLVGRQNVGIRSGSIVLAGDGFDNKMASKIAKTTRMQVIFGKDVLPIAISNGIADVCLKADRGIFVASPTLGTVYDTRLHEVMIPEAKQLVNDQVVLPKRRSTPVAGFTRAKNAYLNLDSNVRLSRPETPERSRVRRI